DSQSAIWLLLYIARLEWTSPVVMAGPGLADPASPGQVHGPSNCSPVEFSNGSSDFDAGPVFNIYALVSCNLSVVYEIVMLAKLQSLPYGCA
ncbi:unnamed protein product, partial [Brassica rapa]